MCRPSGMCGKSTVFSGNSGSSTAMEARLRRRAVLGVLDDALAARLTRLPCVAECDLDADLVLAHEVVADRAAQPRDDVLLRRDSLGFLDCVCHGADAPVLLAPQYYPATR